MNNALNIGERLRGNAYPGRGIIVGQLKDGRAVFAYFIMGRNQPQPRVRRGRAGLKDPTVRRE